MSGDYLRTNFSWLLFGANKLVLNIDRLFGSVLLERSGGIRLFSCRFGQRSRA
jgi:hypothetical protein